VLLTELLTDGPVPVKAVEAAASEAGVSSWALRKARERCARSYRPAGFDGPYVLELLHNTPPQSATNSSKQQQPGDCRWSSLIDADCEQESKNGARPRMKQASSDASPAALKQRLHKIAALPEAEAEVAYQALKAEMAVVV
jgi:hypothetical protein